MERLFIVLGRKAVGEPLTENLYTGIDGDTAVKKLEEAGASSAIVEGVIIRNPQFYKRKNFVKSTPGQLSARQVKLANDLEKLKALTQAKSKAPAPPASFMESAKAETERLAAEATGKGDDKGKGKK